MQTEHSPGGTTPPIAAEHTLKVAMLLTLSGGFLDAFTFVGHGHVFANAMTGNVVFLGISATQGNWSQALREAFPILAFLIGIFVVHLMKFNHSRGVWFRPAEICLSLEILLLILVSFLPQSFPDILLVSSIALVAAMQNSSFLHMEGWNYNSVMTTGNLRLCAEGFFSATMRQDPRAMRQARLFGLICLCFLGGAALGAVATAHLHHLALWIPILMLATALLLCVVHAREPASRRIVLRRGKRAFAE